ncbi:hypothetical protein, partial [Rhizobium sp. RU36D]|uniref:hypothetical protein n=1 Tax=Rhizobium sp. RU36D TaxID=1907415 RepID=UPI001AED0537
GSRYTWIDETSHPVTFDAQECLIKVLPGHRLRISAVSFTLELPATAFKPLISLSVGARMNGAFQL